jgi:hypothetical protein
MKTACDRPGCDRPLDGRPNGTLLPESDGWCNACGRALTSEAKARVDKLFTTRQTDLTTACSIAVGARR